MLALDSMVLHKSGPRPDLAHRFINFMLDGHNSAELTNLIGSGNPNRDALQYINPEIAQNPAVFPDRATSAAGNAARSEMCIRDRSIARRANRTTGQAVPERDEDHAR